MFRRQPKSARAFTLVEMLVVLGIIAVLVALLMPAVMSAVNSARRAKIATELSQLSGAVEAYKNDKGDYPPNFRDCTVFLRHVRRCYPKIDPAHLNQFIQVVWDDTSYNATTNIPPNTVVPIVDEGESLVFWLRNVEGDVRYPFKLATGGSSTSPKRYYQFDEKRLIDLSAEDGDDDGFPSYRAAYSKQSCYIYCDSRTYAWHLDFDGTPSNTFATAEEGNCGNVRPYFQDAGTVYMNPTTFQILCAGQDGEFGSSSVASDYPRRFPSGLNYSEDEMDNMTNFSDGRRLEDNIP